MLKKMFKEIEKKMQASVKVTEDEFAKIHAGRATPAMLDPVVVEAYGVQNKLNQVATVNIPDAKHIIIQPWDKTLLPAIEKAILKANLGFTPSNDGNVIRITLPPLTGERRKELVKVAKKIAEEGKIAIRNLRKHYKNEIEKMEKEHQISEDEKKRALKELQDLTDKYTKKIEEFFEAKEKELLTV